MDNYVGKRLDGRYEIQEIIGVGGMSVVYKAYDNVDDRIVAVKILKDEFLTNDDFVRRFKNESKAIALLSHPNIVKVFDVSFGEKLQYIVMEHVDGITLKEFINKQNVITWNDALFFTIQILKALQHAHDKGIVHRDIKPQNIILLSDGSIKVADFGIARFSRSETKTLTDTAIGSVHYISPEQAKGEFTDERADIYSVGVVLYEMLAGNVPFEADNAVSVALMQLQNDAKKLTDINPDIPLGLEQICIHAMQKDSNDRYQTATEMLLDIEEVIKNPATVFDYSYFVDKEPTKYVVKDEYAVQPDEFYEDDEDEYYDPHHKRKVVTAVIIGVIILIGAIVALVMGITGSFNTSSKVLESFIGRSYDELISSNEYTYQFILETEKTEDAQPGTILSQSPEAGTKVIADSKIILVVAASMDDISIPNTYDLNEEKAKKALDQAGLVNYKFTTVSSDTVEEGIVVYSDPKAGSVVSSDTPIVVYISSGPTSAVVETIRVPDVKGLKQEGARAFLEKCGFSKVTFTIEDSMMPKGTVISQTPSQGTVVNPDETIKVIISSGTTTTTTTTSVSYDIPLSVELPVIEGQTDNLIVELDGKSFITKTVKLDGSKVSFTIHLSEGDDVALRVSLSNIGVQQTEQLYASQNSSSIVDFSSYSVEPDVTANGNE